MAEAWTRQLKGDVLEAYSAGIHPKTVDPRAVKAMGEVGIDISSYTSKVVNDLEVNQFDFVVTVCDNANENCPLYPAKTRRVHKAFDDPPHLAADAKTEDDAMKYYRRVRDEIREFVITLPESLMQ